MHLQHTVLLDVAHLTNMLLLMYTCLFFIADILKKLMLMPADTLIIRCILIQFLRTGIQVLCDLLYTF